MKGFIHVQAGELDVRMPIIDLKLAAGQLVVTAQMVGPMVLPRQGLVYVLDPDGEEVVRGTWRIPEAHEAADRTMVTTILPVNLIS